MTVTEMFLKKLESYEMVSNPGLVELEKAMRVFNEFSVAFQEECSQEIEEEKQRAEINYKRLRGGK